MDWNKSKSILIIAFIIVNIFLLIVIFDDELISNNYEAVDKSFIEDVVSDLKQKNINVLCEIPLETHSLPLLEIDYKILEPENKIIKNFLGNNIEAEENKYIYKNESGETLEIKNNKLLIYEKRKPKKLNQGEQVNIDEQEMYNILKDKNISLDEYEKSFEYKCDDTCCIMFTKKYSKFNIENAYIKVYFDSQGLYKLEIQEIEEIRSNGGNINVTCASEALLRLFIDDNIRDKNITNIQLCYYTKKVEDWDKVATINADPTWKVEFDDGTYEYLIEKD